MRIGLALSGGGFRATLYHLGMIRYLRDANLLTSVTHITSVSGGSVLAAHLALNWDRYCGDSQEFESAAREVLDFVQLDVRNRILRRYPFAVAESSALRLVGRKLQRPLTRTVLLEQHYRHHLFGDTCLHQLPQSPELHILCTNLSGGGLSSFTRDGLLMETRDASGRSSMRLHQVGLATVPMAVAASSAFPGFFPPLELTAETVGATPGQFQTQYFTDGGVYDNLGIRMFYHINDMLRETLHEEDFIDVAEAMQAWQHASQQQEPTPLRRVFEICSQQADGGLNGNFPQEPQQFAHGMRRLITSGELHLDLPLQELIHRSGNGSNGHSNGSNGHSNGSNGHSNGSNRSLQMDRTVTQTDRMVTPMDPRRITKGVCASPMSAIVSYSHSPSNAAWARTFSDLAISRSIPFLRVMPARRFRFPATRDWAGYWARPCVPRTSLMDRVWQLEQEHFRNAKGVVFSPITRRVSPRRRPHGAPSRGAKANQPHPHRHGSVQRTRDQRTGATRLLRFQEIMDRGDANRRRGRSHATALGSHPARRHTGRAVRSRSQANGEQQRPPRPWRRVNCRRPHSADT